MTTPGHGGRRPGAGRPPTYTEPMVRKTVLLPASYLPLLEREGNGNLSEGLRFLIEQARTPGGGYWFPLGRAQPLAAPRPDTGHDGHEKGGAPDRRAPTARSAAGRRGNQTEAQ